MSLEIMSVGEVLRARKRDLAPGTLINMFGDYASVSAFVFNLAHKLHTGAGRPAVRYLSRTAEAALLIDNTAFRNQTGFWGRISPKLALIIPADISFVPKNKRLDLNQDGIVFLLSYGLISSGKERETAPHHIVACALFREQHRALVWVYARKRTERYMDSLISKTEDPLAQRLKEGWTMLVSPPR